MKSIKDLAPKPSDAVQAMIDGLIENSKRADFIINMGTFGDMHKDTCYGCAATCTLQKIANVKFKDTELIETVAGRSSLCSLSASEVDDFEWCIDLFRQGSHFALFNFYGLEAPKIDTDWELNTSDWKEQIPNVVIYVAQLRELGL